MVKRARRRRNNLIIRPLGPELHHYYDLERRRVAQGLKYWVRHGSDYWYAKVKKAKTQEARDKARMMNRVGASFVLSARYYLNALSMLTFVAEQVDVSTQVLLTLDKGLRGVGLGPTFFKTYTKIFRDIRENMKVQKKAQQKISNEIPYIR